MRRTVVYSKVGKLWCVVNKVLVNTNMLICLGVESGCSHATTAELSRCHGDCVVHKAEDMHCVALGRESSLIPASRGSSAEPGFTSTFDSQSS